jgi:hypothetical protein
MIRISLTLACDGCGRELPGGPVIHYNTLMRRQIEYVRGRGSKKGWRRYRLKNTAPNGDYCPACQKKALRKVRG